MLLALVGSMLCLFNNQASVLFVNLNSTNASLPFASWNTAATNIQNAIDAADVGDLILVTNGLYDTGGEIFPINNNTLTNRVVVSKAVTVQSVNGPLVTIIYGYQVPGGANGVSAIRCV